MRLEDKLSGLSGIARFSSNELACLSNLQGRSFRVSRGSELDLECQTTRRAFVLLSGWCCCYKSLVSGGRQIISFPLPGDFMGLECIMLRSSDHSLIALTDVLVSSFSAAKLTALFEEFPRVAAAIFWAASRDEAMVVEHLVDIGRRSAIDRVAHCLLELRQRLLLVGLASETEFECPLTQYELADALGLSPIHVNRVLRQLRQRDLLTLKSHRVVVHDLPGLVRLAGYDDGYLNQYPSMTPTFCHMCID